MKKPPAASPVAKDDGEGDGAKFAMGKVYSVKLITGDEFNGIVLAYDSNPNFVSFEEGMKSKKPGDLKNIRMVNANFITELKNLGKVKDPLAKKHMILLDALKSKERDAISNIERIGIGVTVEAQIIFDTLSKTHPVRWVDTDILAMGEVLIRSPYHSDCVFGGPRVVNNEVKRVLGLTRKKLELTDTGDNEGFVQ